MADRYVTQLEFTNPVYMPDCPVALEKGAVLLDTKKNTYFLQLKFANLGTRDITSIRACIVSVDSAKKSAYAVIPVNYDEFAATGKAFGTKKLIPLPNNNAVRFGVYVLEVKTADGQAFAFNQKQYVKSGNSIDITSKREQLVQAAALNAQYHELIQAKNSASTGQKYKDLAARFREMNGYENSSELADECDDAAIKVQYDCLVQEKNSALTEQKYKDLAARFREMNGYENSTELADECEKQCQLLKELREEQEARKKKKVKQLIKIIIPAAAAILIAVMGYWLYDGWFAPMFNRHLAIPYGAATIGDREFAGKQLTRVEIPDSVTSIGRGAFRRNRLTSVTIGANVTLASNAVGFGFEDFYRRNGMAAGTYIRLNPRNNDWSAWHGNFRFQYNEGNITITGYNGTGGDIEIPAEISGIPVTIIENSAFRDSRLTSVNIPDSVITIGNSAFAGNQLTSVSIGNSVTSIGVTAFLSNRLTSIFIPNSVRDIAVHAFTDNPLTSIRIGPNVNLGSGDNHAGVLGFGTGFNTAYANARRQAGTYTRPHINSTSWTRRGW